MLVTLSDLLPKNGQPPTNDFLLGQFLEYTKSAGLELYPAQEAAILELYEENNVILNTPTGSGKSLVATALQFKAVAQGKRSVYTCPIKALVNEKWLSLCRLFGPENVGLSTGDATVNLRAPILCCTAEILANLALREGARADVQDIILDEFHYYSDRDRGGAWQVPLLALPQSRFLLMSATLGDTRFFEEELTRLNGKPTITVAAGERPVPLEFTYAQTPLSQTLENLVTEGKGPVYVVHFTQANAAENAQSFTSLPLCSKEEKARIADALVGFRFSSPYGPELKRWLRHGIGLHHAGLLPKYRVLIEQLAQRGLLKVICGTDTLGVGINVPIRSVLLTRLCKYDGQKTAILSARDFHQITGRAGRKGYDDRGYVVAQAPEHFIENLVLEQKASGKKFVRRKPPEKGFVNWDKTTFTRLITAPPERLTPQWQISHGTLLNVLGREHEDGCRAMQQLIRQSHDTPKAKKALFKRAWQLFRALVERKIVHFTPRDDEGVHLRLDVGLQHDFSMNQTLSLYLHDTLSQIDPAAPDYALVVLTMAESILEDPDLILRKQLDRLKTAAMAEMKMDGLSFDQRIEELEKLEYPKPNREFIYSTFNAFAEKHPWVGQENIRPKSIAREMFEEFRSFADYIKLYELQRAEGLLLRHLSGVHKVLTQTVPDSAKNDALREMEIFLGAMIRQVDSSLLEEWERMRDPDYKPRSMEEAEAELRPPGAEEAARDITRDAERFTALIRNRIFLFLRALASGDAEGALASLADTTPSEGHEAASVPPAAQAEEAEEEPWTVERLRHSFDEYRDAGHVRIRLDPTARNRQHTYVIPGEGENARNHWIVQQMLVDPDEANDWVAEFAVDLVRSRALGEPSLRLRRVSLL